MKAKTALQAIALFVVLTQVIVLVTLGLSILTILKIAQATASSPEGPFRLSGGATPDGGFNGTITWQIRNDGPLEILPKFRVTLRSSGGESLGEVSDSKRVMSGAVESLSLSLNIPGLLAQKIDKAEIQLEIRTFFDLVGFSVSVPFPFKVG